MYVAQPIAWTVRGVTMLDQRRLPAEEISYTYTDYREVAKAIREMVIRGAPAIGVAAATSDSPVAAGTRGIVDGGTAQRRWPLRPSIAPSRGRPVVPG